jgi:branched-chain amino acid transport system substrate-binding protein
MKARSVLGLCATAVLAVVVAACGSSGSSSSTGKVSGTNLTVYSSLPLQGGLSDVTKAANQGSAMALAAAGGKVGKYTITFKPLDDSTAAAGSWDAGQTTNNAHTACDNSSTIGYLGEFNSGASAISIPVLNRCGIPQISPSNTAVGLTLAGNGAAPGEPQKYYPTGKRTYARVVPYDTVQAAAQAALQKSEGCTKTYVLQDQEVYGLGLANNFKTYAPKQGIQVVGVAAFDPKASNYRSQAASIPATGANCVFLSTIASNNAVELAKDVGAAVPNAKIFSGDGDETDKFFDPSKGGIPTSLDSRVFLTAPTLSPSSYPPAGQAFFKDYTAKYGKPEVYAIYGYAEMALLLDAIKRASNGGNGSLSRSAVDSAIHSTSNLQSVLGTYSINANGDTTITDYGAYGVKNGSDFYLKTIHATV